MRPPVLRPVDASVFQLQRDARLRAARDWDAVGALPWAWAQGPLAPAMVEWMTSQQPRPAPGDMGALAGKTSGVLTPRQHRHHSARQPGALDLSAAAWGRAQLAWLGQWHRAVHDDAWQTLHAEDVTLDTQCAQMWSAWSRRDVWTHLDLWEEHFVPAATRAFRGVMARASIPTHARSRILQDLRDGFLMLLHHAEQPAWPSLALRVVEAGPLGPVHELSSVLGPPRVEQLAECVVSSGGERGRLCRVLFPNIPTSVGRRAALSAFVRSSPSALQAVLDAELTVRLWSGWHRQSGLAPESMCHLIGQNHSKARARLRAVGAQDVDRVMGRLLALPGLCRRTYGAVARLAERWAYREIATHFAMDVNRPLTDRCVMADAGLASIPHESYALVRCWLVCVVLRGRLPILEDWVRGQTLDKDSGWDRLQQQVPDALTDGGAGRKRGYHRLRAFVLDHLPAMLDDIAPVVARVAMVDLGPRQTKAAVHALLEPMWTEGIRRPASGFPAILRQARVVRDELVERGILEAACV